MTPLAEIGTIAGVRLARLQPHSDHRGWFLELRRDSWLDGVADACAQTNLAWSRAGVIRGLHYHERGQDDLFTCLVGTARMVLLDRRPRSPTEGAVWRRDLDAQAPVAVLVPGAVAHGYEALTDCLVAYHVTREYDPSDPDEHGISWRDARVRELWSGVEPIVSERDL